MSTIGIIGAMDIEVETLKKHMTIRRTVTRANMEFCEGVLSGHEAVVVKSVMSSLRGHVLFRSLKEDITQQCAPASWSENFT